MTLQNHWKARAEQTGDSRGIFFIGGYITLSSVFLAGYAEKQTVSPYFCEFTV